MTFLKRAREKISSLIYRDEIATAEPSLPPLRSVELLRIKAEHRFNLADQGWTTISYDVPVDRLQLTFKALLEASKIFFDLPASEKQKYQTEEGTEEGWSHVVGEKEFITLRTIDETPPVLKQEAVEFWAEAGGFLSGLVGNIAASLELPPESLALYSEPCSRLGQQKTATMLRIFRYEGFEGTQSKTVSEAHRDLGLLSLAIGDTPGLEVWDRHAGIWYPLEKDFPAGTLMVGRQLEALTNGRYRSGGHLVRSHPSQPSTSSVESPLYRHSVVFVLRAHSPVKVDTDELITSITGDFNKPLRGITAGDLFSNIRNSHYNINTQTAKRDKQRKNLARAK